MRFYYLGLINVILSWRAWIPLSRISFAMYLLHPALMFLYYLQVVVPMHYDDWTMVSRKLNNYRCVNQPLCAVTEYVMAETLYKIAAKKYIFKLTNNYIIICLLNCLFRCCWFLQIYYYAGNIILSGTVSLLIACLAEFPMASLSRFVRGYWGIDWNRPLQLQAENELVVVNPIPEPTGRY